MSHRVPRRFHTYHLSRRAALRAGSLGVAAAVVPLGSAHVSSQTGTPGPETAANMTDDGLSAEISELFRGFPGEGAFIFWAPSDAGRPGWSAAHNADTPLFVASAFKVFVLAEYLRQAEQALDPLSATPLADQLDTQLREELTLDETVFSPGADVFNSPNMSGKVMARTVLDAMIAHSDNTATDMALKRVGPDRVRELIASLGLEQTRILDSTRQFFAYVLGAPDWQTLTWDPLLELLTADPHPHRPILNDTITAASTADELVTFYARALQGELFLYAETLVLFRTILSTAHLIPAVMPLGVNAFLKSGSFTGPPVAVQAVAGGLFTAKRWVYYAALFNWEEAAWGPLAEVQPELLTRMRTAFTLIRDRFEA